MLLTSLFIGSRANTLSHTPPRTGLAALAIVSAACILAACGGGDGSNGTNGNTALVKSSAEAAGANCAAGGTRVQSGLDLDSSGSLDPAEITGTSFICNGAAGAVGAGGAPGAAAVANLVRTTPEPAGANCASGGIRIQSGADTSGDGSLQPAEVTQTSYACNGATGTTGTPGAPGTPGAVGGTGAAGFNSLILTTPEPAGANCPAGGLKVESGLDLSRDGSLQNSEVTATSYICKAPTDAVKKWSEPALLETLSGAATNPQIATDFTTGNAVAVWQQFEGFNLNIYAKTYTAGVGWGAATVLDAGADDAANPQVAMDTRGNAIVVWQQFFAGASVIIANRYTAGAGGGWGGATGLSVGNESTEPRIAMDSSGNAIVAWRKFINDPVTVVYAFESIRYVAGAGWQSVQRLATEFAGVINVEPELVIAMEPNASTAIAVYKTRIAGKYRFYASRNTAIGASWSAAVPVSTPDPELIRSMKLKIDTSGNAIAIWRKPFGIVGEDIMYNRYINGRGWGAEDIVERLAGDAFQPDLAIDAGGNAIVVWGNIDDGQSRIFASRTSSSDPAAPWTTPVRISPGVAYNAADAGSGSPHIGMDANGNAIVVFSQYSAAGESLWSNRFTAGGGWEQPLLLAESVSTRFSARIAVDAFGKAIVLWDNKTGLTGSDIVFSQYP